VSVYKLPFLFLSFPQSLGGNPVFLMSSGCPSTDFGNDGLKFDFIHRLKLVLTNYN